MDRHIDPSVQEHPLDLCREHSFPAGVGANWGRGLAPFPLIATRSDNLDYDLHFRMKTSQAFFDQRSLRTRQVAATGANHDPPCASHIGADARTSGFGS